MRAIQIRPEFVVAHDYLGNAFMQLRKWNQAAEQYEAVLRLDSGRVVERVNLTVAYQQLGRFDEAVEQARTVLQSQPDNPQARAFCENVIASRGTSAGRAN
jgi:tetratricopeptide (TPR) repeat protein